MLEKLLIMKEKLQWLQKFFEQTDTVCKNIAELLLNAINIPRKTSWQDPFMLNLIETTNKQRILFDELISFYNITIVNDISNLIENLDIDINYLLKEKEELEKELKSIFIKLEDKKEVYIEAIENRRIDPWLCSVQLKSILKDYLIEREKTNVKSKVKTECKLKKMDEFQNSYQNILINFNKIQQNFYEKILDTFDNKHFLCEEEYYDIENYDEKSAINHSFENEYRNVLDQIKEEIKVKCNHEIDNDEKILKYGIFKYRKPSKSTWFPCLIVLSSNLFMHAFDLDIIVKNNENIRCKYQKLISRLYNSPIKRFTSLFDNPKYESLNFKEEMTLIELVEEIMTSQNYVNAIIQNFSFNMKDKVYKIDKEKYEIILDNKNTNSFVNFFVSHAIKIKSYILKDLYELYFAFSNHKCKKVENDLEKQEYSTEAKVKNNDISDNPIKLTEESNSDENIKWKDIQDNNPWEG